jgi:septation ring formation regulator EzrA
MAVTLGTFNFSVSALYCAFTTLFSTMSLRVPLSELMDTDWTEALAVLRKELDLPSDTRDLVMGLQSKVETLKTDAQRENQCCEAMFPLVQKTMEQVKSTMGDDQTKVFIQQELPVNEQEKTPQKAIEEELQHWDQQHNAIQEELQQFDQQHEAIQEELRRLDQQHEAIREGMCRRDRQHESIQEELKNIQQ